VLQAQLEAAGFGGGGGGGFGVGEDEDGRGRSASGGSGRGESGLDYVVVVDACRGRGRGSVDAGVAPFLARHGEFARQQARRSAALSAQACAGAVVGCFPPRATRRR
jgi:hypothetical protein